ncbi:MAG: DUF5131 family protein [Deltaproteobacteria bacterium]|nr:DUF5131 family protein [Deltaproteobacteria bacterium]
MTDTWNGRYWDLPWSLVDGCTPCSPGCDHCWSAGIAHRFYREGEPGHCMGILTDDNGRFNGDIITHPERLSIPLKRRKPTVYAVWNDLFHEAVPDDFIDQVFNEIGFHAIHYTFLILSKRPQRMAEYFKRLQTVASHPRNPFPNVWSGLTVCNQQEADEKMPVFLQVPGKKFLSIEPMLGPMDLTDLGPVKENDAHGWSCLWDTPLRSRIDAVILGGETGPGARPMHPDWVRSVRDQCTVSNIPFFFKEWGKHRPGLKDLWGVDYERRLKLMPDRYEIMNAGRLLDGRTHDELPWVKS